MLLPTLGAWHITLMSIAFIFVCVLLILLILIQRPKGGGLAGAFGGAGGSDQAMFGAKAGDALTWITVSFFAAFLLLAMGLTWAVKPTLELAPPAITTHQSGEVPEAPLTPGTAATPVTSEAPAAEAATEVIPAAVDAAVPATTPIPTPATETAP